MSTKNTNNYEEPIEAATVLKNPLPIRLMPTLTDPTETSDGLSTEDGAIAPINSPKNSLLTQETTKMCSHCSKISEMTDLVECEICPIKGSDCHR